MTHKLSPAKDTPNRSYGAVANSKKRAGKATSG